MTVRNNGLECRLIVIYCSVPYPSWVEGIGMCLLGVKFKFAMMLVPS